MDSKNVCEGDAVEALLGMLQLVTGDLLLGRETKPRRKGVEMPSVPERVATGPTHAGIYISERRGNRSVAFAQADSHESRKGIEIIRHMLPWWE
jgi:hypothetical protein